MLNKIITLLIRGGITFGIGVLAIVILYDGLGVTGDIRFVPADIIWIAGGIYSLLNFNNSYKFSALEKVDNKASELIDNKNKLKIEQEMLRVKKLLDNNILTEEEYSHKMKSLKQKYL